ncbi:uncharacterized protein LOC123270643 [Cotesia glomerata]|nr:uncharacterized protein LOC123270643 [Cotesia glomerata]
MTTAVIESGIQVVVQSPAPTMPEEQQPELEQIQEVKDISLDLERDQENNNLSVNSYQQEQEQDSGGKIEPQINLISDSIQDNYQDLMTSTMILTRQENFIEDDGNLDRTTGLYIRLVIKQDGRPDLVWLYKTHKF